MRLAVNFWGELKVACLKNYFWPQAHSTCDRKLYQFCRTLHLCESPGSFISALDVFLLNYKQNIEWFWRANRYAYQIASYFLLGIGEDKPKQHFLSRGASNIFFSLGFFCQRFDSFKKCKRFELVVENSSCLLWNKYIVISKSSTW